MKTVFIILLMVGISTKYCISQTNGNDQQPPDGHWDGAAFFALRSCHQLLQGDSGEFSSPDYLCSNPPLWCNWTIRVEPGKRINLVLEDLTPADACLLKPDEVHVDEPPGVPGGAHRSLRQCWREARYTSVSDTLHVVLLIGGHPHPPYRGFYGRYQAFGPPIMFNPRDDSAEWDGTPWDGTAWAEHTATQPPLGQSGFTRFTPAWDGEPTETVLLEQPTVPVQPNYELYEYYDQPNAVANELPRETEEPMDREEALAFYPIEREEEGVQLEEVRHRSYPGTEGLDLTATPAVMLATRGTSPAPEGGVTRTPRPTSTERKRPSPRVPSAMRRNVDAQSQERTSSPAPEASGATRNQSTEAVPSEPAADGRDGTRLREASDQLPSPPDASTSDRSEEEALPHPHPHMVEPLAGKKGSGNPRNDTAVPHLPGDHLFEVSVEVNFHNVTEARWDQGARDLLASIKDLIYEQLERLNTLKTMSSKRIKRLSAGVLYIIWLQIGGIPEGPHVHRVLHAALQGLIETKVSFRGGHNQAVIVSVSTADVNECGTQLVLCDANAACVNRFGSYSCHCRAGTRDLSRLGSGGTLCLDPVAPGTDPPSEQVLLASPPSPERQHHEPGCGAGSSAVLTKGVYVVFFLLSSLMLLLLAAVGVLYHRHRRGAFLVPCHDGGFSGAKHGPAPDGNNSGGFLAPDAELPPPPPPIRRPKEGWPRPKDPPVDLPLLRFSPLMPLESYREPADGARM